MKQPVQSFLPIRATVLRKAGAPPKIECLEMEGPREDEALVRMVASGICHTDIDFCEGGAFGPVVLGHEGCGLVEQAGQKVKGFLSVIQGDAVPQEFIPKLIKLFQNGRFPFERLVKFYKFSEINRAIADSKRGRTVKPVLLISKCL